MEIILASSSPRRKEILNNLGLNFKIVSPDIDEAVKSGENAVAYARRIAMEKGESVLLELQNIISDRNLVISCDTIVLLGKKILGKPDTKESAQKMLFNLKNNKHYVISALSLIYSTPKFRRKAVAHSVSAVKFKDYSKEALAQYLDTMEWQGKAGSYAIQGQGSFFLEWFQGSFSSIIGFPLRVFFRALSAVEVEILSMWD